MNSVSKVFLENWIWEYLEHFNYIALHCMGVFKWLKTCSLLKIHKNINKEITHRRILIHINNTFLISYTDCFYHMDPDSQSLMLTRLEIGTLRSKFPGLQTSFLIQTKLLSTVSNTYLLMIANAVAILSIRPELRIQIEMTVSTLLPPANGIHSSACWIEFSIYFVTYAFYQWLISFSSVSFCTCYTLIKVSSYHETVVADDKMDSCILQNV